MQKLRIKRIRAIKLFGTLTHDIRLDSSGITFIHGPNGSGKTTILNIINAIFSLRFYPLIKTTFNEISIEFNNGHRLNVTQKIKTKKLRDKFDEIHYSRQYLEKEISFIINYPGKNDSKQFKLNLATGDSVFDYHRMPPNEISAKIPFLRRVGPRKWRDMRTDESISYEDAMEMYSEIVLFENHEIPDWLLEVKKNVDIQYIKTQRLFLIDNIESIRESERRIPEAIEIYSHQLEEMISRKIAEQASTSQRYDSTFPKRLLQGKIRNETEEEIRNRYKSIEEKTKALVDAGLISKLEHIPLPVRTLPESQLQVMTLYLDDMEKKLSVFDDLLKKIQTFTNIISSKLRGKEISIDRDEGFYITFNSPENSTKKDRLRASQLSSGEQHQIVLFYELVFKSEENSLYLIDEPEISLHVDWQRRFVEDLMKVKELGKCYFLIATHSPQIIGEHFESAIPLDGGILEGVQ